MYNDHCPGGEIDDWTPDLLTRSLYSGKTAVWTTNDVIMEEAKMGKCRLLHTEFCGGISKGEVTFERRERDAP